MKEEKAMGNCYEANANKLLWGKEFQDKKLVHGVAINQNDYQAMGHCWIEDDNYCYDYSNGKTLKVEKNLYYEIGCMPIQGYKNHAYSLKEVRENVLNYGHYGPWETETPR